MTTTTVQTRWYKFHQNNSGGKFREPAVEVWIEALDHKHANQRAQDVANIYFDGCESGRDCSCCGDRWHEVYDITAEPLTERPVDVGLASGRWAKYDKIAAGVAYPLNGNPIVLPVSTSREY